MKTLAIACIPLLWVALILTACGSDKAECGGIVNSGTLTGPVSSNCANGNAGPSGAGTTDRHDTTDNHAGAAAPAEAIR